MAGTPLILLPGLMCDRAVWTETMAALPGGNPIDVSAYGDLDTLGLMAARALDQAPPRFAAAGHSMGGRVALEMFRRAPERVAGIALLDTNYRPRPVGEAGAREEYERMELFALARRAGTRVMGEAWVKGMVHASRLADAGLIGAILDMFGRKTADTFAAQIRALLARPDAAALLRAIRCPALVLCGREDSWAPLARHEEMAAMIPGSRLAVVDRCGHMSPMERPEAVASALGEWLHRVDTREHSSSGAPAAADS